MPNQKRKKGVTALSEQRKDPTWQALDGRIGGRDGLLQAALVSADPKAATLAELLLDPKFKSAGTKALAKRAGLSAAEIVDIYRNRKWLEATLALHDNLPVIVEGAAKDAAPSEIPCDECKASGTSETGDHCWVCRGKGTVRKPGDRDKLRFIGEATGMVKGGGQTVNVNTQINTAVNSGGNSFEDLLRRATIQPKRQIEAKEAEVVHGDD